MTRLYARPDQVITLNDFPVHHEQCLKIYFRIFSTGHSDIIPPCPVIHKSTGTPFIKGSSKTAQKYNAVLAKFLEDRPESEYFLLDGTHRTTAAALSHSEIPLLVFQGDNDIRDAKKLVKQGELFSLTTGNSITDCVRILQRHFVKTMLFQTVAEKTLKMVRQKVVPQYMIDFYKKSA